jgi:hypothetical protein
MEHEIVIFFLIFALRVFPKFRRDHVFAFPICAAERERVPMPCYSFQSALLFVLTGLVQSKQNKRWGIEFDLQPAAIAHGSISASEDSWAATLGQFRLLAKRR